MLNVVITMAGLGSRFRKAGYNVPKYEIEVHGRTLFEWSMESLKGFNDVPCKYIFIVRAEDQAASFIKEKMQLFNISDVHIIEIDHMTDGQATTAMLARDCWDPDGELIVYNIDTYVEAYAMKYADLKGDGFIPCFKAEGDHWSFVRTEGDKVVEIREKKRISDNCTLGLYYFKSCQLYESIYQQYYKGNEHMEMNEKYIAPLYNYMLEQGYQIYISDIDPEKVHVLGTPEELEVFRQEALK